MSQWQPIETAPKDETAVFLWGCIEGSPYSRPHIGIDDLVQAYWDEKAQAWRAIDYEGWVPAPTHWMPLPAPPTSEK